VTNNTIAIAQQMKASGAAEPSPRATVAGITKIPAPIVELTMFAVNAGTPIPRTSFSSVRSARWIVQDFLKTGKWEGSTKYCGSRAAQAYKLCDFACQPT
jgi:hypothetical protein